MILALPAQSSKPDKMVGDDDVLLSMNKPDQGRRFFKGKTGLEGQWEVC
jgi:hypothetical protein